MLKVRISNFVARMRTKWAIASETERDHIRILFWLIILMMVAGLGYFLGKPIYRKWQRDKSMKAAYDFVEKKDYRSALLSMRRATEMDLNDAGMWKSVAEFLSELDSPETLTARRNLVIMAPSDISLRLAYVVDALRFGEIESARQMMDGVSEAQRKDTAFFRMAVAFSYATGMYDQMEENLATLVLQDPNDWESAFNLACLRLWGPSEEQSKRAQKLIKSLCSNPKARTRASLELLKWVGRTGTRRQVADLVAFLLEKGTGKPFGRLPGRRSTRNPQVGRNS